MLRFSFRREKDNNFKHIAHGLIPAASIAPKPAVPRTPPPRSPDPSPERPRSALAAAILSSSLTGQTWAIPPARPRSFSESGLSESFPSEPNISKAHFIRDRWSDDLASRPRLSSPDQSEEELEDKEEEVESEEAKEDHVYQSLERDRNYPITEPVYSLPLKPKSSTPQLIQMPGRRMSSPDFPEEASVPSPKAGSSKKKASRRKSHGGRRHESSVTIPDRLSRAKNPKPSTPPAPAPNEVRSKVQEEAESARPVRNTRLAEEQKLLEERLHRLEQEISHSQASSNPRTSAGAQAELLNLRRHAQELVDENDALKMTVHRLNVELSRYQTRFRPLTKQESSRISGLPKAGSPPWQLDMKYLSPLMLAYEDRLNEKDAVLQTAEEEVKKLRLGVEEVNKENQRLRDEIAKMGGSSQKNNQQLQEQALLVLQENQDLIDQLEAQHVKAKTNQNRHQAEVSKMSKQLMLLEAENERLQEELEQSQKEAHKNKREVQDLQARLKDAITWDEHCNIAGKLRRQLEQQDSKNKTEMDELQLRLSSLQEENRSLAVDRADLTAHLKRMEAEQDVAKQANRKAERRMSVLKKQKEECVLKEENTRHYLGAVISVAEHISQERDQLLHMASALQQEKQGFVCRMLNGTVRFGKLQEEVKVYRRQASSKLAVLEEAAEARTASYQREILHLQRLLKERQEAEERLLQSKREVEEELEVVWQAATRENQQMRATLLDSRPSVDLHAWPPPAPGEVMTSTQRRPHSSGPPLLTSDPSPDTDHLNNSLDTKHKHGLDFYC